MADLTIDASAHANTPRGMRSMVFTSANVGYFFYLDFDGDFYYVKTTNGGNTWGAKVTIDTAEVTVHAFDVWYDQWTPGDTGSIIHLWWFGITADNVKYKGLDTRSDTLGSLITVFDGASSTSARGSFVSGAKMRGGNLLCAFDIDAGAEHGTYKSTDNGATWSAMTDAVEATIDQCFVFPANAADPQDAWLLYQDASTDELTVKTYDDSANTFSESGALTMAENVTDLTAQYGFSGSIRHQDGHLIFAFMNDFDAVGEDFLCYDWDGTTATALTALTTDIDDMYYPSVYLNQDQPDYIYIAYIGKSDGSETLLTTAAVYYALSKDRGVSWTKDIAYSTSSTIYRQTWTPLNGERFMVAFSDTGTPGISTNQDKSISFGYSTFNNYQAPRAVGQNNTGILQVSGKE